VQSDRIGRVDQVPHGRDVNSDNREVAKDRLLITVELSLPRRPLLIGNRPATHPARVGLQLAHDLGSSPRTTGFSSGHVLNVAANGDGADVAAGVVGREDGSDMVVDGLLGSDASWSFGASGEQLLPD
jgi:hypothetical protein